MHSRLEDYLAELEACLASLPRSRRVSELKEMRAHLETMMAHCEGAHSSEEAVRHAIDRFGTSGSVAAATVAAWRRGEAQRKRQLWGAAVCAPILTLVFTSLLFPIDHTHSQHALDSKGEWWVNVCLALLWTTPPFLIAGCLTGLIFPKSAVAGASLAVGALALSCLVIQIPIDIGDVSARSGSLASLVWMSLSMRLPFCGAEVVATFVAAWGGSQWRRRQSGTVRA